MKKVILTILAIAVFTGSSLNANSSVEKEAIIMDDYFSCHHYAELIGRIFEYNNENYWEGYFGGYGDCMSW